MHALHNAFALTKSSYAPPSVQAQETPEVATAVEAVAAPTTDADELGDGRVVSPAKGLSLRMFCCVSFPPMSPTASRTAFNTCQCRYHMSSHYHFDPNPSSLPTPSARSSRITTATGRAKTGITTTMGR